MDTPNTRIHARIPEDIARGLLAFTNPPHGPKVGRTAAIVHLLRLGLDASSARESAYHEGGARVVRPLPRRAARTARKGK